MICLFLLAGLLMLLCPGRRVEAFAAVQQAVLTPQEKRGKQIYLQGSSSSSALEIRAYLGEAALEVPGSAMACVNCHGFDGAGKPEGGVAPSNLTWEALTKPYGVTHPDGRTHPPYTERALELAITRGLDPAGHHLSNVMPRYQMSREDMADLIAYLKRLGKDSDPGLSENRLIIGTILPARAELADLKEAIQTVITAYFAEVNGQGGIYNRQLELKFIETSETPQQTSASVRRFIQDEQVFAMTGAFTAGSEKEVAALVNELEVPMVGPFTLYPQVSHPLNRRVFYLLAGLDGQARSLVNFASHNSSAMNAGVAVISPENELAAGVLEAIKDQCRKKSCGAMETYSYQGGHFDAAAAARKLSQTGGKTIFFLGTGAEGLALLREADKLRWSPLIYLPGGAIGAEVFDAPRSFDRKIFLSFPTSPADQTAEGVEAFRALATKYKLPARHLATQFSVYSAARILVEGLKRTGRDLSREKLVTALEGLHQYATGLSPAVTYGPNRRIGAMGAYVITIDLEQKQFLPASAWIDID